MKHDSCRELYQYWDRIRGGRSAPPRTAIEPADIRGILCDTFILEAGARGAFPFRLAGTRLCAAYGRELKGVDFVQLWHGGDHAEVRLMLAAVGEEARAAVVGVAGFAGTGRTVGYEMLLLPLQQDGPRFDRILGVLAPSALPYWLGLDPITRQSVTSARLIWPDDRPSLANRVGLPPEIIIDPAALGPDRRRERFVVLEGGKPSRS